MKVIDFKYLEYDKGNDDYIYKNGSTTIRLMLVKADDGKFYFSIGQELVKIANIDYSIVDSSYVQVFKNCEYHAPETKQETEVHEETPVDNTPITVSYEKVKTDDKENYYYILDDGKTRSAIRFINGKAYNHQNQSIKLIGVPFNAPKIFKAYRGERPEASIKIMGIDRYKSKHGFGETVKEIQRVCNEAIKKLRELEIADLSMDSLTVEQIAYLKQLADKG